MIKIKLPFDSEYVSSMESEALIVRVTSQGSEILEYLAVSWIKNVIKEENLNHILIRNPEKFDIKEFVNSLKEIANVEESKSYEF